MWTQISGRMPASSQASRALSTASLTVVSRALRGLSNPSRWRFLAKNSLTEMSRWLAAIDWAVALRRGRPSPFDPIAASSPESAATSESESIPSCCGISMAWTGGFVSRLGLAKDSSVNAVARQGGHRPPSKGSRRNALAVPSLPVMADPSRQADCRNYSDSPGGITGGFFRAFGRCWQVCYGRQHKDSPARPIQAETLTEHPRSVLAT